jgi:RNA polymerase sigma factor (sigma-70 family)
LANIGAPNTADAVLGRDVLEKLYYFALRKTGSRHEAEDLAQEIAVQALAGLAGGSRPNDFDRWLWAVARNRYARWAKEKRRRSAFVHDEQILSAQSDDEPSAEASLVRDEELAALRRELALLTKDYREIVVAYYFAGERIADIAARLGVPEGTVKRRLHDCRKSIREGIEMAKEPGVRSFRAEEVKFSKSGRDGRDGSPWNLINRLIPKNILLAAYRNPMTLEELSLELGVAMPYMEEEVRLLTEGTLLREVAKGRFETDFIILDKEMQIEKFHKSEEYGKAFAPLLIEFLDSVLEDVQRIIGQRFERGFLLWTLIPLTVDAIARDVHRLNGVPESRTSRPNDGQWDIVGYEKCELPHSHFVGHNGDGDETGSMWHYKLSLPGLWDRAGELNPFEIRVLTDAIRAGLTRDRLGRVEAGVIDSLVSRGFLADDPKRIVPNFPVFRREDYERLKSWKDSSAYAGLMDIMNEYYRYMYDRIGRGCPARLTEQLKFVTGEQLWSMRMISLRHALAEGHIAAPEHPERSTIAMFMMLL